MDRATRVGLADLRVELGIQGARGFRVLDQATTTATGRFVFQTTTGADLAAKGDSLYHELRVYRETERIQIGGTTRWRPGQVPLRIVLETELPEDAPMVDDPVSAPTESNRTVRGVARHPDGAAIPGITVVGYSRAVGLDTQLTLDSTPQTVTTNTNGVYKIEYDSPSNPHLVVKYVSGETTYTSDVVFNASQHERLDLCVDDDTFRLKSLYAKIHTDLASTVSSATLSAITQDDIDLMAGVSGYTSRQVTWYVGAASLETKLTLTREILFGLLSEKLPFQPDLLAALPAKRVQSALERASARNRVSVSVGTNAAATASDMVDEAAARSAVGPAGSLGKLLVECTTHGSTAIKLIIKLWIESGGDVSAFWTDVAANFTGIQTTKLKRVIALGIATQNHPPMVNLLMATPYDAWALDRFCELLASEWRTEIDTITPAYPTWITGANDTERRNNYAAALVKSFERSFPSRAVHEGILRSYSSGDLFDWVSAHKTDIDLTHDYLDDTTIGDQIPADFDALKAELTKIQRLHKITRVEDRWGGIQALSDEGLDSAASIVAIGKLRFQEKMTATMSDDDIDTIYTNAQRVHGVTSTLLAIHHPNTGRPQVPAIAAPPDVDAVSSPPDGFVELFGTLSACACEDCRSILGPGAYLVDLLAWLDQRGAYDTLDGRRPDLSTLLLTCPNTFTELPYIDLVNEVLENAVAATIPAALLSHDDTSGTTPELLATQQYSNVASYVDLIARIGRPSLPFHLWIERTRVFLAHLGIDRLEMMRTLQRTDGTNPVPSDAEIAFEGLGLCKEAGDIISNATNEAAWGFAFPTTGWNATLAPVSEFMLRGELTRDNVLEILNSDFCNPTTADLHLIPDDECDLTQCTIQSNKTTPVDPSTGHFDAINRFLRLRMATSWSVLELDKVATALGWSTIDDAAVTECAELTEIMEDAGTSLVELLSLWSTIDTKLDHDLALDPVDCLWDATFLDRSKYTEAELLASEFQLTPARTALLHEGSSIDMMDHSQEIIAALSITEAELTEVINQIIDERDPDPANLILSLGDISDVYRRVALARVLGVSVSEAMAWRQLVDVDPFDGVSDARTFIGRVREAQATDFSVDELLMLLRADTDAIGRIGPTEDWIRSVYGPMRDTIQGVVDGVPPEEDDVEGTLCYGALDTLLEDDDDVDEAIGLVGGGYFSEEIGSGPDTKGDRLTELIGAFVEDAALAAFITTYATEPSIDPPAQYKDLLQIVRDGLARLEIQEVVVETIAGALEIDSALVEAFRAHQLGPAPMPSDFTDVFQDATHSFFPIPEVGEPWADITVAMTIPFQVFYVLHRVSVVLACVGVNEAELDWWLTNITAEGLLDLPNLPTQTASDLYTEWRTSTRRFALRDRIPGDAPTFVELIDDDWTDEFELLATLADRTGWVYEDLVSFCDLWELTTLTLVQGSLHRLIDAIEMTELAGVGATELDSWRVAATMDQALSDGIVQAVASKYDSLETWSKVAHPLRDVLREKRRDALATALLADNTLTVETMTELFETYLLDVEMSACQLTSRIVQATGSVQTFIQRIFLGLETGHEFNADDADTWEIIKNYRVWEANRKVFLYPENWIEPELRRDKSELFSELERNLGPGGLTEGIVTTSALRYLETLFDLSNIEVVATYEWRPDDETSELHVIGRTRTEPRATYHRVLYNDAVWSQWWKMDVDIQSANVAVTRFQGRWHVFWLEVSAEDNTAEDGSIERKTEVRLAWSELKNERWSAARWAPDTYTYYDDGSFDPADCMLKCRGAHSHATFLGYEKSTLTLEVIRRTKTGFTMGGGGTAEGSHVTNVLATFTFAPESDSFVLDHKADPYLMWVNKYAVNANLWTRENDDVLYLPGPVILGQDEWATLEVMETAAGVHYDVAVPVNYRYFHTQTPVFYSDQERNYLIRYVGPEAEPAWTMETVENNPSPGGVTAVDSPYPPNEDDSDFQLLQMTFDDRLGVPFVRENFKVVNFHHPYALLMLNETRQLGIDGLLNPDDIASSLSRQQIADLTIFEDNYTPLGVRTPYPDAEIVFGRDDAFGLYNWELFFHLPFLVADRLHDDGRYQDAYNWYRKIYDPTVQHAEFGTGPERFWKVKPLMEPGDQPVTDWAAFTGATGDTAAAEAFAIQVGMWQANPFDPHAIAGVRPGSYQRAILMKFLDNLIAWADKLFVQDTRESINEATQLYIYALDILGPRPAPGLQREPPDPQSFADMRFDLDLLSNAQVQIENMDIHNLLLGAPPPQAAPAPISFYFCVPPNDKLMGYWDTLDDRLFKVRHCQNIAGVVRTLPLFQPPIDPALLVRATALGVDIGTALSDLSARLPLYRYSSVVAQARGLVASVESLGSALQAALEKHDAEELARVRAGHAVATVELLLATRRMQVEEAELQTEAMRDSQAQVEARRDHYVELRKGDGSIGTEDFKRLSSDRTVIPADYDMPNTSGAEQWQHFLLEGAVQDQRQGNTLSLAGGVGGIASGLTSGPASAVAAALQTLSLPGILLSGQAALKQMQSGIWGLVGGHERREAEWDFQIAQADAEVERLDKQIAAADIRWAIARNELDNAEKQFEQSEEVRTYLEGKFTNQELYGWMVGELRTLYYQAYELAYDVAKQAQSCYRFELQQPTATFVQYGYWDAAKEGLLASARLRHALDQMDAAYRDNNIRERELTKHVSLNQIDPVALLRLKTEGICYFELKEVLFDLDVPGQTHRRLKSVSLSLPGIAGPHVTINARLSLHSTKIRTDTANASTAPGEESGIVESIVTSGGANATGLFRFDFSDPRYLPFEGRGAVSKWALELTAFGMHSYDPMTIEDAIVTVQYTARDGGAAFAGARQALLEGELEGYPTFDGPTDTGTTGLLPAVAFSAARQFPDAWHALFNWTGGGDPTLELPLTGEHFPRPEGTEVVITHLEVYLDTPLSQGIGDDDVTFEIEGVSATYTLAGNDPPPPPTGIDVDNDPFPVWKWPGTDAEATPALPTTAPILPATVRVTAVLDNLHTDFVTPDVNPTALDPAAFNDLIVLIRYKIYGI